MSFLSYSCIIKPCLTHPVPPVPVGRNRTLNMEIASLPEPALLQPWLPDGVFSPRLLVEIMLEESNHPLRSFCIHEDPFPSPWPLSQFVSWRHPVWPSVIFFHYMIITSLGSNWLKKFWQGIFDYYKSPALIYHSRLHDYQHLRYFIFSYVSLLKHNRHKSKKSILLKWKFVPAGLVNSRMIVVLILNLLL